MSIASAAQCVKEVVKAATMIDRAHRARCRGAAIEYTVENPFRLGLSLDGRLLAEWGARARTQVLGQTGPIALVGLPAASASRQIGHASATRRPGTESARGRTQTLRIRGYVMAPARR